MATTSQSTTGTALNDVFDLDPETTDLSAVANFSRFDATADCTSNGCGPAPHTSGCATPDGPVVPVHDSDHA